MSDIAAAVHRLVGVTTLRLAASCACGNGNGGRMPRRGGPFHAPCFMLHANVLGSTHLVFLNSVDERTTAQPDNRDSMTWGGKASKLRPETAVGGMTFLCHFCHHIHPHRESSRPKKKRKKKCEAFPRVSDLHPSAGFPELLLVDPTYSFWRTGEVDSRSNHKTISAPIFQSADHVREGRS
jgi:hypothetical protein